MQSTSKNWILLRSFVCDFSRNVHFLFTILTAKLFEARSWSPCIPSKNKADFDWWGNILVLALRNSPTGVLTILLGSYIINYHSLYVERNWPTYDRPPTKSNLTNWSNYINHNTSISCVNILWRGRTQYRFVSFESVISKKSERFISSHVFHRGKKNIYRHALNRFSFCVFFLHLILTEH